MISNILYILRCPLCKYCVNVIKEQNFYYIKCANCGISTRYYEDPKKLMYDWNNVPL